MSREFPQLEIMQRTDYEGIEEDLRRSEIIFTISLRPGQFTAAQKLR